MLGCTNIHAPNYDPDANTDDGSCFDVCYRTNPCISCAEAHSYQRETGVYWIGPSADQAHEIFCDMSLGEYGGGWNLIMKASPGSTFDYSSPYWTEPNVLNDDVPILNNDGTMNFDVDAKYAAFNTLQASEYVVSR